MAKQKKVDFKEIGLDIGLILAKQFFKTEYLHYGYWTDGLTVDNSNIYQAQENYANLILSHIPEGVKSILDVGCGAGKFAEKLLDNGYMVDCVSPSPNLTKHVKNLIGDRCNIFECGYEELNTEKKYDLILFSESFQYIPVHSSIPQSLKFLNNNGHILICDFFRKKVEGTSPIGGGHDLVEFYEYISGQPIETITDIDITQETAPSIDIVDDFLTNTIHPIYNLIFYVLDSNYPKISKFLKWKYKKRLEKINYKYLQRKTNAESFSYFKSYHLMVYKKQ
ncbi:class I SAM-dependent methyltransferase [bacterium]|nr:class I SAM-dependent methyltransferase [bacterium]